MGNYHPHGDASIYDTLVRLAQDFNMRYPLVDGQGNFGSIDGDPPAADALHRGAPRGAGRSHDGRPRQGDRRLHVPNYDETTEEPTVLPTPFPNLLVNGSTGIAVGMATNIPPHNLREVIDGMHLADREHAAGRRPATAPLTTATRSCKQLIRLIPGPDFPTGGIIVGRARHPRRPTLTGRGSILMRAKAEIETIKKGDRQPIVVTEIPYQVNKATLHRADRRPGAREGHRRHLRPARRVRPRRHAHRHRAEARRSRRGGAEQSLQAHPAAVRPSASSCWPSSAAGRRC